MIIEVIFFAFTNTLIEIALKFVIADLIALLVFPVLFSVLLDSIVGEMHLEIGISFERVGRR